MSDSFASWITLSALIASVAWYIYQAPKLDIHQLLMSCACGALCLFGGLLISGAIMKLVGPFANALIPALLVCIGTAVCIAAHSFFIKRQTLADKE